MSELDIIRAWKDKTYRNSLSAEELAQLPEHPAGVIELTNEELAHVDGGAGTTTITITTITTSIYMVCTVYECTITVCSIYGCPTKQIYCPFGTAKA